MWRQEDKASEGGQTANEVDIGEASSDSIATANPAESTRKTDKASETSEDTDGPGAKTGATLSVSESKEDEEKKDEEKKDVPNNQDDPEEEVLAVEELEEGVLEDSAANKEPDHRDFGTQTQMRQKRQKAKMKQKIVAKDAEDERERKKDEVKDPIDDEGNKAEQTKEELGDSGLEISAQEGSDNSADVTDDSKKKETEGKSEEAKQDGSYTWRVLILWTDPKMHGEVRR